MKLCSNCGYNNEDTSTFCYKCGTMFGQNNNDNINNKTNNQQQMQNQNTTYAYTHQTKNNTQKKSMPKIIVAPSEKIVDRISGGGYAYNIFVNRSIGKSEMILTNRRLYFQGEIYDKGSKGLFKKSQDRIVDVENITGTGLTYFQFPLVVILIMIIVAICGAFRGVDSPEITFFALIIDLSIYTFCKIFFQKIMFFVEYAGGGVMINARSFDIDAVKSFNKSIHMIKDMCKKNE